MSGLKTFAVAGSGVLGQAIIKQLLKLKEETVVQSVTVLSRSPTSALADLGANTVQVDYNSSSSLVSALTGIDVVISTVGAFGLPVQDALADAAKAAGVKLFVPSDFGGDVEGENELPLFAVKKALHGKLKDLNLPYATFITGVFPDYAFKPFFGFDFHGGKINFGGSGDSPISWTYTEDVGSFVAHVVTSSPKEKLEWQTFRIEGDRQSFNDIITAYEAHAGVTLDVTRRSRADLEKAFKSNPKDFFSYFFLKWDLGEGVVGEKGNLSNGDYPGWKPKSALETVLKNVEAQKAA